MGGSHRLKKTTLEAYLGPGAAELLNQLPPEAREAFKSITLDLRIGLDSALTKPFRQVSLLDQLALAACDVDEAAYSIYLMAWEAEDRLFTRIDQVGQEKILRWVLASYFPSGALPAGLWDNVRLYLDPEPSENTVPPVVPPDASSPETTRS